MCLFMLYNAQRLMEENMDNYNNDPWNNNQMNGQNSQQNQNGYSAQGYQQPYGADNNQNYQQPYGADNNQNYQQYPNYNQNNYQQYPNYNQYNNLNPVEDSSAKKMAIASLVLSLVSFICCGLPCSIAGLVLGIISKKRQPENNGIATAGIVVSIVALVLWVVFIIFAVACEMFAY